ncbi:MAG: hypothetical protein KC646_06140 [Candidatus Cloacimonetes bacterium]|nr:hypothetical protein [Candidatus Cloacimonadota bacterium]
MKTFILLSIIFSIHVHPSSIDSLDSEHFIVGDSVKISILNNFLEEEVSIPLVAINRADRIIFPHLGEFDISNKTIGQFKFDLKKRVSQRLYLKDPNLLIDINKNILVSVVLQNRFLGDYKMKYKSSLGELLKAVDLITIKEMDPENIHLTRKYTKTIIDLQHNPYLTKTTLEHNDLIKINSRVENTQNYYYLVGNFNKVGRYYMDTKITLMDLLATQTLTQPRYTRKFYIFRKLKHETIIIEADARQLMKMGDLTQNISIQGGDVVLASVERKMHLLQKFRHILDQYTDMDDFIKKTEALRIFD